MSELQRLLSMSVVRDERTNEDIHTHVVSVLRACVFMRAELHVSEVHSE